jgi:hypothetical protein
VTRTPTPVAQPFSPFAQHPQALHGVRAPTRSRCSLRGTSRRRTTGALRLSRAFLASAILPPAPALRSHRHETQPKTHRVLCDIVIDCALASPALPRCTLSPEQRVCPLHAENSHPALAQHGAPTNDTASHSFTPLSHLQDPAARCDARNRNGLRLLLAAPRGRNHALGLAFTYIPPGRHPLRAPTAAPPFSFTFTLQAFALPAAQVGLAALAHLTTSTCARLQSQGAQANKSY